MASVFKRKTDKRSSPWRYKFKDYSGQWKCGIGWPDKKKTLEHAQAVEAEHRVIRKGEKEIPPSWMKNRNIPIEDVTDSYLDWGRAQGGRGGRPWNKRSARDKETYLKWWKKELGLTILADIDLARVEKVIRAELARHCAPKSVWLRVEALRCLCLWAVKRGLLAQNPLQGLAKIDIRPRVPHRVLTDEEVVKLLKVASAQHLLQYETALETGFRVNELRSVRVKELSLFGPSLYLRADYSKDRKEHHQPITRRLAKKLAAAARGKPPEAPLLDIPSSKASSLFNKDLKAAGIRKKTSDGKATWHSLRKVFINNVVKSGCDLKTIQALARHSTAQLSMEVYATADPKLLREAAETAAGHIKDILEHDSWCGYGARTVAGAKGENATPSKA